MEKLADEILKPDENSSREVLEKYGPGGCWGRAETALQVGKSLLYSNQSAVSTFAVRR